MRSRESLRHLALAQSRCDGRERRASAELSRAMVRLENLTLRLRSTDEALDELEQERRALFVQYSGMMTRGDILQLRRRESILESTRIDLMLQRAEVDSALADAQAQSHRAREALIHARRRNHKFTHVLGLFQRDGRLRDQSQEEIEIEEQRYYEH